MVSTVMLVKMLTRIRRLPMQTNDLETPNCFDWTVGLVRLVGLVGLVANIKFKLITMTPIEIDNIYRGTEFIATMIGVHGKNGK
jgi:hypothetical protein